MVAEHEPGVFAILGLYPADLCAPTLVLTGPNGPHTYYRAKSKVHYVLYKAALTGAGAAGSFHEGQR